MSSSFNNTTATPTMLDLIGNATNSHQPSNGTAKEESFISTIVKIRVSIYAICLFLGIGGNILVIIVNMKKTQTSHSRFLLAHLALTDIIFSLRLPIQIQLELNGYEWNYGVAICKIFYALNSMSKFASIGTMTIIAVERYRGITKPILARITKTKLMLSLVLIWIISIITYSPILYIRNVKNQSCREFFFNENLQKAYSIFLLFMKYIFPLAIIGHCYWKIAIVIRSRPIRAFERATERTSQRRRRDRNDNRIVTMLIVLVAGFAIMTLPASIWWLMYDFGGFDSSDSSMEVIEAFAALVYFHSCMNPIIYFAMDRKFRKEVVKMFRCVHHRKSYKLDWKNGINTSATQKPTLPVHIISNQSEISQNGIFTTSSERAFSKI